MHVVTIPAAAARAAIAHAWLGHPGAPTDARLGTIALRPHQLRALGRLRRALDDFGGALLADAVGLGKTYVALALARRARRPLVVAPAALRATWERAASAAAVPVDFASYETLSRGAAPNGSTDPDFVVLDEAHHARNPATRRYRALATLTTRARVLLLSATPIHNRRRDLVSLLALFLGERAARLDPATLARLVVRRTPRDAADTGLPAVGRTRWLPLPDAPDVLAALHAVPPPLPPRDGGVAGSLWSLGLVHLWASSDGALRSGLRRRLARTAALASAVEQGRHLTRAALQRWAVDESTVQLELPLPDDAVENTAVLRPALAAHERALRAALDALPADDLRDHARAELLRAIRRRHAGERVLAFTQFADTARALFRHLAPDGAVGLLTGAGGRVAGGTLSRREIVARFAPRASGLPPPRAADRIDLLLATDCLSEGLDLHDASVVVHLDLPWTPARLAQRVGRAARLGAPHPTVTVYAVAPPGGAAAWLRLGARLRTKAAAARASLGPGTVRAGVAAPAPLGTPRAHRPRNAAPRSGAERSLGVARVVERWSARVPTAHAVAASPCALGVAAATAPVATWLALTLDGKRAELLAEHRGRPTADPRVVERAVRLADAASDDRAPVSPELVRRIVRSIRRHARSRAAARLAIGPPAGADPGGEASGAERLRRMVLARAGALVAAAAPHERARVATDVAALRVAAERPWGVGVERALAALAALPDREWLPAALEALRGRPSTPGPPSAARSGSRGPRIVTILVLRP